MFVSQFWLWHFVWWLSSLHTQVVAYLADCKSLNETNVLHFQLSEASRFTVPILYSTLSKCCLLVYSIQSMTGCRKIVWQSKWDWLMTRQVDNLTYLPFSIQWINIHCLAGSAFQTVGHAKENVHSANLVRVCGFDEGLTEGGALVEVSFCICNYFY